MLAITYNHCSLLLLNINHHFPPLINRLILNFIIIHHLVHQNIIHHFNHLPIHHLIVLCDHHFNHHHHHHRQRLHLYNYHYFHCYIITKCYHSFPLFCSDRLDFEFEIHHHILSVTPYIKSFNRNTEFVIDFRGFKNANSSISYQNLLFYLTI